MDRKFRLMIVIALFACTGLIADAQPGPQAGPEGQEPGMNEMQPGHEPGVGPMGGPGRPGMPGNRMKMDPEREKQMKRNQSLMTMAEAHKNLAGIYEEQGKLDEAAAELYKIIELARDQMAKGSQDQGFQRNIMGKVMPVYHHISQLYIKNNRVADAEKLLLEGIAMFEKDSPGEVSRLNLLLAEIYKNNKDTKKAEEAYKKIIEDSRKNLE